MFYCDAKYLDILGGSGHVLGYLLTYNLSRKPGEQQYKWYKFDDGDVCECNMDDDEVC